MGRQVKNLLAVGLAAALTTQSGCASGGDPARGASVVAGTTAYRGANAIVSSVSCTSPGNCGAGGSYMANLKGGGRVQRALLVSEVNGTWSAGSPVSFPAAAGQVRDSRITAVSCASPGYCAATGVDGRVFVVSEVNGSWGPAHRIRDPAARDGLLNGLVTSVSCASPGNCAAAGNNFGVDAGVFVVSEVNGSWGTASPVAGTVGSEPRTAVTSVSCASPGNCSAGGSNTPASPIQAQAFVASEVHGTWGAAIEVPGTAALNQGGNATVTSVSCGSPGNCAAVGTYWRKGSNTRSFVASEVAGIWRPAREVRSPAALTKVMNEVSVTTVSCASAGDCAAVGNYTGAGSGMLEVSEVHGVWGPTWQLPGPGARKQTVAAVSCSSPASCTAAGWSFPGGVFTVLEVDGTWQPARQMPGPGALRKSRYLAVTSISCATEQYCAGGGFFADGQSNRLHGRDTGSQLQALVFST